jgi:asparagine synthetase B (glutamine-hydrolysing)
MDLRLYPDHGAPLHVAAHAPVDLASVASILLFGFVLPPDSVRCGHDMPAPGMRRTPGGIQCAPHAALDAMRESGSASDPCEYHERLVRTVRSSTAHLDQPWLMQSGGKDSSSLAIALAEARPGIRCLTYVGGMEESESASAATVARRLGLPHETLACDPGRAWDRYVARVPRMPVITGDFALLSYVDMAVHAGIRGADGLIDGIGSDLYFGSIAGASGTLLEWAARGWSRPVQWVERGPWRHSFTACYLLSTLAMHGAERWFPGSRFDARTVSGLVGARWTEQALARWAALAPAFRNRDRHQRRDVAIALSEAAGGFLKGRVATTAAGLRVAYPFADPSWVAWAACLPEHARIDRDRGLNKRIVRQHVQHALGELPYVRRKGSFRFDLRGLARDRFDAVRSMADDVRHVLPGAPAWLDRNRPWLGNKFHASRFYLLAVLVPWLRVHAATLRTEVPA